MTSQPRTQPLHTATHPDVQRFTLRQKEHLLQEHAAYIRCITPIEKRNFERELFKELWAMENPQSSLELLEGQESEKMKWLQGVRVLAVSLHPGLILG